jgi:hypothetical protein
MAKKSNSMSVSKRKLTSAPARGEKKRAELAVTTKKEHPKAKKPNLGIVSLDEEESSSEDEDDDDEKEEETRESEDDSNDDDEEGEDEDEEDEDLDESEDEIECLDDDVPAAGKKSMFMGKD